MSIRDEIRDDIYGSADDSAKREETAADLADLVDQDAPPFAGRKLFAYCAVAEAVVILAILFAPRYVRGLIVMEPEGMIGSVLVPFVIGFITAFTAYRILRNDVLPSRDIPVDDGVMSGYSGYEGSPAPIHHLARRRGRRHSQCPSDLFPARYPLVQ